MDICKTDWINNEKKLKLNVTNNFMNGVSERNYIWYQFIKWIQIVHFVTFTNKIILYYIIHLKENKKWTMLYIENDRIEISSASHCMILKYCCYSNTDHIWSQINILHTHIHYEKLNICILWKWSIEWKHCERFLIFIIFFFSTKKHCERNSPTIHSFNRKYFDANLCLIDINF